MNKTKIDWADSTWNPVTGCYHECEYCYARRMAQRFSGYEPRYGASLTQIKNGCYELGENEQKFYTGKNRKKMKAPYPFEFVPTLHRYWLDRPKKWKEPRTIFVCSMADLFGEWVPDEWIQEVFNACRNAPQHRYLFLTKNSKRYQDLFIRAIRSGNQESNLPDGDNYWYGASITKNHGIEKAGNLIKGFNNFISFEPLLEKIDFPEWHWDYVKWFIIGAETGNRKEKVLPDRNWIEDIVNLADGYGIPVFMKESLRNLMGADFRQEFPWEV